MNWNHYKSIQATIDTMFVNEKIIRIYSLGPFSTNAFYEEYWDKTVNPPWPPKIPHRGWVSKQTEKKDLEPDI